MANEIEDQSLSPEPDSPCGKDDSAETVIPKIAGINPKLLAPTPSHLREPIKPNNCLTCLLDSTIIEEVEPPSGIFALPDDDSKAESHCKNVEELTQNNIENFQDLASAQSAEFSGHYQPFGDEIDQDFAEMAKEQGFDFHEAFEPANDDFEAELISDEKELQDEQRFVIQDDLLKSLDHVQDDDKDEVPKENTSKNEEPLKSVSSSESSNLTKNSESMTDYFQHGSSKLGRSLSSSNSGHSRPHFGFDGPLSSPGNRPVALIDEAEIVKEAIALSMSKNHDLTKEQEIELSEIAKMVRDASPGHDAKFYAALVLKKILELEKAELEASLQLEQGLPSFLEQTVEVRRRSGVLHSSPKKTQQPKNDSKIPRKRVPLGNLTNVENRTIVAKPERKVIFLYILKNTLQDAILISFFYCRIHRHLLNQNSLLRPTG